MPVVVFLTPQLASLPSFYLIRCSWCTGIRSHIWPWVICRQMVSCCSTTLVYPLRRSISGSCRSSSIVLPVGFKAGGVLFGHYGSGHLGSPKDPNMMILLHYLSLVAVHHSSTFNTSHSVGCWHFISSWVSTLLQPSTICSTWNNTSSFNSVGPTSHSLTQKCEFYLANALLLPCIKSPALLMVNS